RPGRTLRRPGYLTSNSQDCMATVAEEIGFQDAYGRYFAGCDIGERLAWMSAKESGGLSGVDFATGRVAKESAVRCNRRISRSQAAPFVARERGGLVWDFSRRISLRRCLRYGRQSQT